MIARYRSRSFVLVALACLSGCSTPPADVGRAPMLSPVGTGLATPPEERAADGNTALPLLLQNSGPLKPINLYNDQRISKVGDIVTVMISINDKASFGNTTDRSQTAKTGFNWTWAFAPPSNSAGAAGSPGTLNNAVTSSSTAQGQGNIDRSEQIQLSVPAVVTQVLPNGNMMIRGSQEVRVNFELRQLTVAGMVHPADISRSNTIAYDRVAEARISYGGHGRLTEVQQPSMGQQVYDLTKPF